MRKEFSEGLNELYTHLKEVLAESNKPIEKARHLKRLPMEFVNEEKLRKIVKDNIVPESNQAAVYLKETDKQIILYVCYLRDFHIIANNDNTHIIIIAEGISKDLSRHFEKSKLIVIK